MILPLFIFWFVTIITFDWNRANILPDISDRGPDDTRFLKNKDVVQLSSREKRSEEILCRGLCEPKKIPACYCDSLCHAYKDCCPEYLSRTPAKLLQFQSEVTCELFATYDMFIRKPYGFAMVKTCLEKYSASALAGKCSRVVSTIDPLQMVPVTSENGLSFMNIFCALCNDVEDALPWDLTTFLADKSVLSIQNLQVMLQTLSNLSVLVPLPGNSVKPRVCIKTETLKNFNNFEDDRCRNYQEPVIYAAEVYRNRHCIAEDVIKRCRIGVDAYRCKHVCIEGRNQDMTDYIFDRNPRMNSILISFGRFRLENEFSRCTTGELLAVSKVQCVHLSCTDSFDKQCKPYELYYTNFKLFFQWYLHTNSTTSLLSIKRCGNILLNILSFSKIISIPQHFVIKSYEEKECDVSVMNAAVTYVGVLPVANAESLQTWLSTVHFTYTEMRGNTRSVIQRIYPGRVNLSDTPHHITCIRGRDRIRVDTSEDKESMVSALARYPLPIPVYKCSHINITMSVEELTDKKGVINRKYKVMEVHCTNNVRVLIFGSLNTMAMVCLGTLKILFRSYLE